MKLNKLQRYALAIWLGEKVKKLWIDSSVVTKFDEFCDGEISEWRIISTFGLSGKIWNVLDRIYITGYSHGEISRYAYDEQQGIISRWDDEIRLLLSTYE